MGQKKHVKATTKQLQALKLINEGMSPHEAMLRAGYSKRVAGHPKRYLMKAQAIQSLIERFHLELKDEGITTAYLAKKYKEWLDAHLTQILTLAKDKTGQPITMEVDKPDYKTQIEAAKMLKEIFNLTPTYKDSESLTRRITFEEWIKPVPEA